MLDLMPKYLIKKNSFWILWLLQYDQPRFAVYGEGLIDTLFSSIQDGKPIKKDWSIMLVHRSTEAGFDLRELTIDLCKESGQVCSIDEEGFTSDNIEMIYKEMKRLCPSLPIDGPSPVLEDLATGTTIRRIKLEPSDLFSKNRQLMNRWREMMGSAYVD